PQRGIGVYMPVQRFGDAPDAEPPARASARRSRHESRSRREAARTATSEKSRSSWRPAFGAAQVVCVTPQTPVPELAHGRSALRMVAELRLAGWLPGDGGRLVPATRLCWDVGEGLGVQSGGVHGVLRSWVG